MNKTATPGTRQAAEGLSHLTDRHGEMLMSILDSAERCANLLQGVMALLEARGDSGTAQILSVVHMETCGAADDLARFLGVRCDL